jgi:hypothetical protein
MSEPLPDALCQKGDDGYILAANKKARAVLNKHFEKPRPSWRGIAHAPGAIITSPAYRALEIDGGPAMLAMLCALHYAGLRTLYWCEGCGHLHVMDDERARVLWMTAVSGAEGVMPEHRSVQ